MGRYINSSSSHNPINSSSLKNWITKTANYTAVSNDCIAADTSGGAFTITLPLNPVLNCSIYIVDIANSFYTNNLTIARNGSLIMNAEQDLILNRSNYSVELVYASSNGGWIVSF